MKQNLLIFSLTISLITAPMPSLAAEKGSLPLSRAIQIALAYNPTLQASAARKDAAVGRQIQARTWQNPELELSAEDTPLNRSRLSQGKRMIGISQSLPWPGKRKADIDTGTADVAASTADWSLDRAEMVRQVKVAYFRAQAAERRAGVAEDLVKVAEAAAATATKRTTAGESTLQEQLRAEIQLEQTRSEMTEAQGEAQIARQELMLLIGRQDLKDAMLSDPPVDTVDSSLASRAPSMWLPNHPEMIAAKARLAQAVAIAKRAGLESMPDVKVSVAGGRDEAAEENLMEFRLSLPLPLFDKSKGKKQEALAAIHEAEAGITATQQKLTGEWRTASAHYNAAARQVTSCRERMLPKSEEALRLVRTGFEEGKFGFIDLIDTQRTTAETRMIYQKKIFELNAARADLEALTEPTPSH